MLTPIITLHTSLSITASEEQHELSWDLDEEDTERPVQKKTAKAIKAYLRTKSDALGFYPKSLMRRAHLIQTDAGEKFFVEVCAEPVVSADEHKTNHAIAQEYDRLYITFFETGKLFAKLENLADKNGEYAFGTDLRTNDPSYERVENRQVFELASLLIERCSVTQTVTTVHLAVAGHPPLVLNIPRDFRREEDIGQTKSFVGIVHCVWPDHGFAVLIPGDGKSSERIFVFVDEVQIVELEEIKANGQVFEGSIKRTGTDIEHIRIDKGWAIDEINVIADDLFHEDRHSHIKPSESDEKTKPDPGEIQ